MQSPKSGSANDGSLVPPSPFSSSNTSPTAASAAASAPNNNPTSTGASFSPSSRRVTPPKPSDFKFGKEIGHGSFSTVYVGREIATQREFAIKVINKQQVSGNRSVRLAIFMEREVLRRTSHRLIIGLMYTFQDASRLYFVLQYAQRGHLLNYLHKLTSFNKEGTRFYASELLLALRYLHSQAIVHRDVKPENILLTLDMHIKLADFGSAMILKDCTLEAPGFTGTPEYVSPEMLQFCATSITFSDSESEGEGEKRAKDSRPSNKPPSAAVAKDDIEVDNLPDLSYLMDYWALGCVVYQMLSGRLPFRADKFGHPFDVFQKVNALDYSFPEMFDEKAKDLVKRLLVHSPAERLGSPATGGPDALLSHPFFAGVDWETLVDSEPPTLIPNLEPLEHNDWDKIPAGYTASQKYFFSQELAVIANQISEMQREELLKKQSAENAFHRFVRGRLIIKQGVLYKRRGLFARKRVFLLTEGPHLFYVDPDAMVLKGEVPWSNFLRVECRNSKIFSIIVPNRIYYLEDPSGHSEEWRNKLRQVKALYYSDPID